jgi:hypothetical protein
MSFEASVAEMKEAYAALQAKYRSAADWAEKQNKWAQAMLHERHMAVAAGVQLAKVLAQCAPDPMDASELGEIQRARAEALEGWRKLSVVLGVKQPERDPAGDLPRGEDDELYAKEGE